MGVLPSNTNLDITPNPLQGEPKDKPIPRKVYHPKEYNSNSELEGGNRRQRRQGISRKNGLPKVSSRSNSPHKDRSRNRRRKVRGKGK